MREGAAGPRGRRRISGRTSRGLGERRYPAGMRSTLRYAGQAAITPGVKRYGHPSAGKGRTPAPPPPGKPVSERETAVSAAPGHGCPPDIAMTAPAPGWGRGQSWRYPVGSRIRFFSGISPCSGPWWLSPRGVGTRTFLSGTPTPPALRAPPPPPPGGEGSAGDIRGKAVSGNTAGAGFPEG